MMNIEADVREIRQQVEAISKKLDQLLLERETLGIMKISERSLYAFLDDEPELYSVRDIRTAYK
jgi:hypothetical protein